jgi:hypothetical protein
MRWLRSAVVVGLLASVGILIPAAPACACSCVEFTPEEAFASSDAVFAGRVVDIVDPWPGPVISSADPVTVAFEVSAVYKGDVPVNAQVQTARDGASCGYDFAEGGWYLVHVQSDQAGEWTTGLCSGNQRLAAGAIPTDGYAPAGPVNHPQEWRFAALAAAGVAVVAAAGAILLLRRSRRRRAATIRPGKFVDFERDPEG